MEHTFNNPVGNAFVTLLLSKRRQPQQREFNDYQDEKAVKVELQGTKITSLMYVHNNDNLMTCMVTYSINFMQLSGSQTRKKRQIQNRWCVAYTLVRNPCLCQLRASNMSAERKVTNGDDPTLKFKE